MRWELLSSNFMPEKPQVIFISGIKCKRNNRRRRQIGASGVLRSNLFRIWIYKDASWENVMLWQINLFISLSKVLSSAHIALIFYGNIHVVYYSHGD